MHAKLEITHVTIRRVQNGFVVDAINEDIWERHRAYLSDEKEVSQQRTCFIAKDVTELALLLQGFLDLGEIQWNTSLPIPKLTDGRRVARAATDPDA